VWRWPFERDPRHGGGPRDFVSDQGYGSHLFYVVHAHDTGALQDSGGDGGGSGEEGLLAAFLMEKRFAGGAHEYGELKPRQFI
jgi:hypothetical protein